MENDKLVRLSDVIETIENQCTDGNMWGNENLTLIDARKTIDELSDVPAVDAVPAAATVFGKWIKDNSIGMSPGGTPGYVCSQCGESFHLHGAEFPRRKMICDKCGSINSYPWEKTYEKAELDDVTE